MQERNSARTFIPEEKQKMTAPHVTNLRSPLFINKEAAMREFNDSRFLLDPVVRALKPECPLEHSYGYFVRLISNGMENVVEDMAFSRLPESAWVLMQNLGACNEEYNQSLHLVLYQGKPLIDFDRSNWRYSPRILELLSLAYRRGQALESCAAIRREAIRAYLTGGIPAMAEVLRPVPGLFVQAAEATTLS
jgi:hypothetical protein